MVNLSQACATFGVRPEDHMSNANIQAPSFPETMQNAFGGRKLTPMCPRSRATFSWWDETKRPLPKKVDITACRILLSNLITEQEIKYKWVKGTPKPNTVLEVSVRYPDAMNYPSELSELITDRHGNMIFHVDHPCTQAFNDDMASRRGEDGYAWDDFQVTFEEEQDPVFVSVVDAHLTGFDLLRGKWTNSDGELCAFRMLQILVKNKDLDENSNGIASGADFGVTGGSRRRSAGPFMPMDINTNSGATPPPPVTSSSEYQDLLASKARIEQSERAQREEVARLRARTKAAEQSANQRIKVEKDRESEKARLQEQVDRLKQKAIDASLRAQQRTADANAAVEQEKAKLRHRFDTALKEKTQQERAMLQAEINHLEAKAKEASMRARERTAEAEAAVEQEKAKLHHHFDKALEEKTQAERATLQAEINRLEAKAKEASRRARERTAEAEAHEAELRSRFDRELRAQTQDERARLEAQISNLQADFSQRVHQRTAAEVAVEVEREKAELHGFFEQAFEERLDHELNDLNTRLHDTLKLQETKDQELARLKGQLALLRAAEAHAATQNQNQNHHSTADGYEHNQHQQSTVNGGGFDGINLDVNMALDENDLDIASSILNDFSPMSSSSDISSFS